MKNSRDAAFSSGPMADHSWRRSGRVDLLFMPPPSQSAEQKGAISRRGGSTYTSKHAATSSKAGIRRLWVLATSSRAGM